MKSIFRYSRKDGILVLIAILQLALLVFWCLNFGKTSFFQDTVLLVVSALLFYFNPIVITHNFLHCPFFKKSSLNSYFAVINSMNFGLPQILYKFHHLTHHKFNNDPVYEGTTKDPSSTFRFGHDGEQEHFISYCALGLFRDGTSIAYRQATAKSSDKTQFLLELAAVFLFHGLMIYINWLWYFSCYILVFYIGWFLAHLENYYEHYAATDPQNRFANSVSYYHRGYNFLMFNEGFHQEHHIKPAVHWTQRPKVRKRFIHELKDNGAYAANYPPLLGFLDKS